MVTKSEYEQNKEDILRKNREYYYRNKEKVLAKQKSNYTRNKKRILKRQKVYYKRTKVLRCKWQCEYTKRKVKTDSYFKLKRNLRTRIYNAIKNQRATKSLKLIELMGCTGKEVYDYITLLLKPGMSWDNYGEWHIDHIIPCASFDLKDPEQQKQCFHYTNLQPLWATENQQKSDSLTFLK